MSAAQSESRLLLTVAVMSAAFLQVLDTTIVNVALPHIAGELSATPDQISWVLTSYLVATGVMLPLTGYFSERWGQRRFLFVSIFGFVIASGLCGVSTNLTALILFRILQGIFGAPLIPLSQSILVQAFSAEERGRAMAIWGMGIMLAPIMGPTLGGYLTDVLTWRWTFFINLPMGMLSLLIAIRTVPDTPRRSRTFDWLGFLLLFAAIGGLQFVIDRGNQEDWFESDAIVIAAVLSIVGFLAFVYRGFVRRETALFDLRIFRDRNFITGCALVTTYQMSLFGAILLTPLYFEDLLGYPADLAGVLMAPRGVAGLISMLVVGRYIARVPPRTLILGGIALWALGAFPMTHYGLQMNTWFLLWPMIIQGLGLGMVFVPGATIAYATLPREVSAEAAGLYNLIRTVGTSIGISLTATIFAHQAQVAWNETGSQIHPFNPAMEGYFDGLGMSLFDPGVPSVLAHEVLRQSLMIGMVDALAVLAWSFVLMLPLAFLLRGGQPHHHGKPAVAALK